MEQKLIDIMFEMVFTAATHEWFQGKSTEDIAAWVRSELANNNIHVYPVGASHGYLSSYTPTAER